MNLPLVFILLIIFIIVSEIYILRYGYIWLLWNTYHIQVQNVWTFRRTTIKIANWGLLWQFQIRHCHRRPTPTPFQIYILNTNRRQFTSYGECLCHQPLQIISHRGSEQLNWGDWWLVWDVITSFGRSDDLYNHRYVYFIVMGGQVQIDSCIV